MTYYSALNKAKQVMHLRSLCIFKPSFSRAESVIEMFQGPYTIAFVTVEKFFGCFF